MDKTMQNAIDDIAGLRRMEYVRQKAAETQLDSAHIPPPTDEQLGVPFNAMMARWDSGYLVVDLNRMRELPKSQQTKILKLGGMK